MRIGILGSGQLGMMLAQAAETLGHSCIFYDSSPGLSAARLGPITKGEFDDLNALKSFAQECDVITYEFENIPCETANFLNQIKPVYPPPRALEVSQDRLIEKEFLQKLGIGTPRFQSASTEAELTDACLTLGLPCIAKTRRFGYDGKGQARITSIQDIPNAWQELKGVPLLVEGFVPFNRELSVIATRDANDGIKLYPLSFNTHRDGILHRSEIPAPDVPSAIRDLAYAAMTKVLRDLKYVGTLAVELFEVRGEILANEMAPRVHNSGHATIECVRTSQFANHIRAVTGMALGDVDPLSRAVMFNIIGKVPNLNEVSKLPNATIHLYGKDERPGRKLGHITLLNPSKKEENLVSSLILDIPMN